MHSTNSEDLAAFRRQLHAHPELSERETGTARRISERLKRTGPDALVEGLGSMGTGLCALYEGASPGPTVLLRAELDALPISETNTFPHRSTTEGVSHKCGHDGHMTTLVAVADGLGENRPERGSVILLFQPAEETGTGAAAVIRDPRFAGLPKPDYVYAFHNVPKYPVGRVLVRSGVFAQASVGFIAEFTGRTSHSSYPEHGVSPAPAVTQLVDEVNAFGDRLGDRVSAPVLGTVSYAELGSAEKGPNFGTTPGRGCVMGVIRAHESEDLETLRGILATRTAELAEVSGLGHEVSWHEEFRATSADAGCVDTIVRAAEAVGLEVETLDAPFRWSEDFGYFTDAYTGAFFGLGSGTDQPQLHDDGYDYPDELIATGARLYRAIIDEHLAA